MSNSELESGFLGTLLALKGLLGAELRKPARGEALSVSIAEYVLMKKLAHHADGKLNLTEAAECLFVTKSAVSHMLGTLEKRGLLIRNSDPANRRNLLVFLTPAGQRVLRDMDREAGDRIRRIVSQLGQEQTREFIALASKVNEAIAASENIQEVSYDND